MKISLVLLKFDIASFFDYLTASIFDANFWNVCWTVDLVFEILHTPTASHFS
jgi:hypothetical protein